MRTPCASATLNKSTLSRENPWDAVIFGAEAAVFFCAGMNSLGVLKVHGPVEHAYQPLLKFKP